MPIPARPRTTALPSMPSCAVLGFASRLETIVCTQSCTMMTLSEGHMEELCQLSYEFKAELTVIA